jgi:hypothetical protein
MDDKEVALARHAPVFLDLVEGRLEPEDWVAWWEQHRDEVQRLISPGTLLHLKAKGVNERGGVNRAAANSQGGAIRVLDLLGIAYTYSDRYYQVWQQAEEEFLREWEAAKAAKTKEYVPTIQQLAGHFPRFARFLKANLDDIDYIRPGLDEAALSQREQELGTRLPGAYRTFLQCASEVGFKDFLHMNSSHPFVHDSTRVALPTQGMVAIAELWLEADGDQIMFDLRGDAGDDPPVLYYAHGLPAVRPFAANFTAWIEALPRTLRQ